MLNWHAVVDLEVREIERERRLLQIRSETERIETEEAQRAIAHELSMQQLEQDIARETELNARIAALWPSASSSSTQDPAPERDSPM